EIYRAPRCGAGCRSVPQGGSRGRTKRPRRREATSGIARQSHADRPARSGSGDFRRCPRSAESRRRRFRAFARCLRQRQEPLPASVWRRKPSTRYIGRVGTHFRDSWITEASSEADAQMGRVKERLRGSQKTDSISKRRNKMKTKGKVLVLVSSGHGLPLQDGKVYSGAGYYLNELTVPVRALMKEGYEITFANPKGNTPQMDVNSAIAQFFGGDEAKLQDYLKFRD